MSSKLREALSEIIDTINKWRTDGVMEHWQYSQLFDIADAALAAQKYEAKWDLGAEYEFAYCSHCGHQQWASWDSWREAVENIGEFCKEYKFCPNCGFEMKGTNNEQ